MKTSITENITKTFKDVSSFAEERIWRDKNIAYAILFSFQAGFMLRFIFFPAFDPLALLIFVLVLAFFATLASWYGINKERRGEHLRPVAFSLTISLVIFLLMLARSIVLM